MVTVRAATEDDLDELAALGAALARLHHGWDKDRFSSASTDDVEDGYRWWFSQEMKKSGVCFRVVANVANVASGTPAEDGVRANVEGDVGLCGYVYGRREGRDWNRLLDPHAALIDLYVRPAHRHNGIASALVDAFVAWAAQQKAGPVVLSTAAQNAEAQALFRKLGFRPTMIEMTRG